MRQEDIEPDEEVVPSGLMWHQKKGCIIALLFIILFLGGIAVFGWQVKKYYDALKTGQMTPEMRELIGTVTDEGELGQIVTRDDDPSIGPDDAKIYVISFQDFQCPISQQAFEGLRKVVDDYQDRVLFVYRDFPTGHTFSQTAAEAAECADEQNSFWTYHDLLFANPELITEESAFVTLAERADLDSVVFEECLQEGRYTDEVNKDFVDGQVAGVSGTPTFFINGYKLEGAYPQEFWRQSFDGLLEELEKQE